MKVKYFRTQNKGVKMSLDLSKYGIEDVVEIFHNPSYDLLYEHETNPDLEGYEKGQVSELGAVNVMTGVFTGRSPKDKFIVEDDITRDTIWWTSDKAKNDNKPTTPEVLNIWNIIAAYSIGI